MFLVHLGAALLVLAAGCLAPPCGMQPPPPASMSADARTVQKQTIAAIERRGGSVVLDGTNPNKPVVTRADLHSIRNAQAILTSLGPLTSLRVLNLYDTGFGDADLRLLHGLEELHTLNLSGTNVTDAGLEELASLPKLRVLELNQTRITDAGLQRLRTLPTLRELGLAGSRVTNAGLAEIGRMKDLEQLSLGGGGITDAGLDQLRGLRHLKRLVLCGSVTGPAVEDLRVAMPWVVIIH
jgi:hypothetical protein